VSSSSYSDVGFWATFISPPNVPSNLPQPQPPSSAPRRPLSHLHILFRIPRIINIQDGHGHGAELWVNGRNGRRSGRGQAGFGARKGVGTGLAGGSIAFHAARLKLQTEPISSFLRGQKTH
jgi:hypothetical protein